MVSRNESCLSSVVYLLLAWLAVHALCGNSSRVCFEGCVELDETKCMNSMLWWRAEQMIGRERNQRPCHRQLIRDLVARRRVNSTVMSDRYRRPLVTAQNYLLDSQSSGSVQNYRTGNLVALRPHIINLPWDLTVSRDNAS